MIADFKVVSIIPARGGSKAIKNKNLRYLGGKPLVCWPIDSSRNLPEIDRIVVSTDDKAIAKVSEKCGAEVILRAPELATDKSLVIDTVRDLIPKICVEPNYRHIFLLLEPTSPFRSSKTIRSCLARIVDDGFDSVATFSQAAINPERVWSIKNGVPTPFLKNAVPWLPRQHLKPAYELNGAVYAFIADQLPQKGVSLLFGKFAAEIITSDEVIDIDTERDLKIANAILTAK